MLVGFSQDHGDAHALALGNRIDLVRVVAVDKELGSGMVIGRGEIHAFLPGRGNRH